MFEAHRYAHQLAGGPVRFHIETDIILAKGRRPHLSQREAILLLIFCTQAVQRVGNAQCDSMQPVTHITKLCCLQNLFLTDSQRKMCASW